jgi:hypothetical protein
VSTAVVGEVVLVEAGTVEVVLELDVDVVVD